ncbi:TIGR04255 family protein [Pelagibius marinus]|uniref:TIGR04255 family protein n=1 Tax=Pelagibius marinus TaxID=2762760 RepID=UPI0029CA8A32|nr:TIGR04255 family protein [Pelagibius marinus]
MQYHRNPLIEVVCQFRFPKLLRLEAELPADFQDKIKPKFPLLKENTGFEFAMAVGEEFASAPPVAKTQVRSYNFFSSDKDWNVGISSTSFSLTCKNYKRWEEFKEHLDLIREAFVSIYGPPYIQRCGLRYINVIDPVDLGLEQSSFSELISADLVGDGYKAMLGSDSLRELSGSYSMSLSSRGHFFRVSYGLVKHPKEPRNGFKIDSDFWVEGELEPASNDITESLDGFNRAAGSLFQHSIEEHLFEALGPKALS